ncbi:MAG: hypothetical protein RR147_04695 [Oscillospiraceae bacterium]
MKKIAALALALTMCVALVACAPKDKPKESEKPAEPTMSAKPEAPAVPENSVKPEEQGEPAEPGFDSDWTGLEKKFDTAYLGTSDDGADVVFVYNATTGVGAFTKASLQTGEFVYYVGALADKGNGAFTLTDGETGNTLNISVAANADGTAKLDAGTVGKFSVSTCEITDALTKLTSFGVPTLKA